MLYLGLDVQSKWMTAIDRLRASFYNAASHGVRNGLPMFALNFYHELYGDLLRKGRKTATIRLGDKSDKYKSGQLVWVTIGRRFGPRQKLFTAIIDEVEVKSAGELSTRDVEKESSEMRLPEEVMTLLSRIYDRIVTPLDKVTVISFSPVWEDEGNRRSEDNTFERWTV